jgi:hypothetical protein
MALAQDGLEDVLVTTTHMRMVRIGGQKVCVSGGRQWAEQRGLDWRKFVQRGVMASEILDKTKDVLALQLIATARAAAEQGVQDGMRV